MYVCRQPALLIMLLLIALTSMPDSGFADSLVIPDISTQPSNGPEGIPRPTRSMTMDQVRDQFGPPQEILGPVGTPPITRWVYDKFVVHFEDQYVIHSTIRRKP